MSSIMQAPEQLVKSFDDSHVERAEIPESVPAETESIEPHSYGSPSTLGRESNYVSDESLLLWLAEKTDGKYGELRDAMDTSRRRSKFIEDLSHIKAMADRGATDEEISAELEKLAEAYRGTEFEQELNEFLAPLVSYAVMVQHGSRWIPEELTVAVSDKVLSQALESRIDALARDDQLALITIQSLTADIREAQQLASNLMASSNQAANAIIGNVAR